MHERPELLLWLRDRLRHFYRPKETTHGNDEALPHRETAG